MTSDIWFNSIAEINGKEDHRFLQLMARRRLADFLSIASATRNIIKRHVDIQLQIASRVVATSSVTKAVKRNFQGSLVVNPLHPPLSSSPPSKGKEEQLLDGKDQDVFYERSDAHSTNQESIPEGLKEPTKKKGKEYAPDAARASKKSKPMNPIQDQYVRKMSTQRAIHFETAGDKTESSELRKSQNEEVSYETKATTTATTNNTPNHIPNVSTQPTKSHDKLSEGIDNELQYSNPVSERKPKSVPPELSSL